MRVLRCFWDSDQVLSGLLAPYNVTKNYYNTLQAVYNNSRTIVAGHINSGILKGTMRLVGTLQYNHKVHVTSEGHKARAFLLMRYRFQIWTLEKPVTMTRVWHIAQALPVTVIATSQAVPAVSLPSPITFWPATTTKMKTVRGRSNGDNDRKTSQVHLINFHYYIIYWLHQTNRSTRSSEEGQYPLVVSLPCTTK